jgi:eukaryotic-like serine/threonine-protein kinase
VPSPQNREEVLFALALDMPAAKRPALLDAMCADDPALRQRLETLLAAHHGSDQSPPSDAPAAKATIKIDLAEAEDEAVGKTIGRYKVLEKVGEGGCGVVYVAEQTEPVRRRVALKVIRLGMNTKAVVARFEAERQALAMMDHPNIAKVLDAGTTETGRPFFVMELVRGIRITEYCDQNNLTTKERLDLFIKVCQAIQHAHQKGIIHRDIKPSNILVTMRDGVPVPKVIDFGIAKATEGRLTEATVYTQLHQFIGTPAYMSPEQAEMSGLDIDTRSDIYSLGVLLYELLTGSTPFDSNELVASGIDAMRKTIREKEPMRPSTRLATLEGDELTTTAKRRSADNAKLLHQLRGDLDWIVMKCLEKDRTRRYDTANGLAYDLRRHLSNEPVLARPPSAAYKFQKAFRRNKLVFAAGVSVAAALLLGTIVSTWQSVRATRAKQEALAEKAIALAEKSNAQAALHFIQDDVLSQASPGYQPDRDLKVSTLVDRIAGRLDGTTERPPPLVEASIRQTLGSVYTELGDNAKAIENYERALELERQNLGESHLDTLRSLYGLAMARWWNANMAQAEALARQGLDESRRVLGDKHPLTLQFMQARDYALVYSGVMPWNDLEPLFLQTLALHCEFLGPDDPATLRLIYGFGLGYRLNFQPGKGVAMVADAVERSRRVLGEQHPLTAGLMATLCVMYADLNQFDKAEPMALRALELRRSLLGEENLLTVSAISGVARVYVMQRKLDKAEPLAERLLDLSRRLQFENNPFLPWNLSYLGWEYLEKGREDKAATLCEAAFQAMRRKPVVSALDATIITDLGAVRLAQRKYDEAEALLRESWPLAEKFWPADAYRFYVMDLLGASLAGQKKYGEAEPFLLQGCQGLQQSQASMSPHLNANRRITESLEWLVQLYDAWGKPAQAPEWKQKLAAFQQTTKAAEKKGPQP